MPPLADPSSSGSQGPSSEHRACTQNFTLSVEMPGGQRAHVALSADEGMTILLVVLIFMTVVALGLVTAATLRRSTRRGRSSRQK